MKRQRPSENTKIQIAQRLKSEDAEDLAAEYGLAVSTIKDYGSQFGNRRPRKVKRRVVPKENTRVSDLEKQLRATEIERDLWKESYMRVITNRE